MTLNIRLLTASAVLLGLSATAHAEQDRHGPKHAQSPEHIITDGRVVGQHTIFVTLRRLYALVVAADRITEGIEASKTAALEAAKLHALMLEEKRQLERLNRMLDQRLRAIEQRLPAK